MRNRYHRGRLGHAWAMVRQPEPRDSRSMDTVVWADRMFVNIASYFLGFIVFFALSCLLLVGGVRLMSENPNFTTVIRNPPDANFLTD